MKHQLELENEQWLPIEGYEDLYQVSNLGRVKSLERKITYRNSLKTVKERILKQATKKGYQQVCLCKDGNIKWFSVHRLVANAFIDNPNNYEQVNHKDENKCNNHVSNLEWCNRKYNINYGTRNERHSKSMIGKFSGKNHPLYGKLGKDNPNSKQIIQLTLGGEVINTWGGTREIQRKLGYNQSSICKCCKGKQKTSNGYKWSYA